MNGLGAVGGEGRGRIVAGVAHSMEMGETRGRTLFPSPEFSHWPPFEALVEVTTVGAPDPDLHPHAEEEVVNYVISGSLLHYDEQRRATEVPAGSVSLFSTVRRQMHDLGPKPSTTAHWLSLILRLPRGATDPAAAHQVAPATRLPALAPGVMEGSLVGASGPIRSQLGLEMRDLRWSEDRQVVLRAGRSELLYVVDGHARAADEDLPAGSGLLADGLTSVPVWGARGTRLVHASVGSRP